MLISLNKGLINTNDRHSELDSESHKVARYKKHTIVN